MEGYAEEKASDMSLHIRKGVSHREKWRTNNSGKRYTCVNTQVFGTKFWEHSSM